MGCRAAGLYPMPKPNDESLPTADRAAPAWISAASSISEWVEVDQQTIDAFAAATGDHQWIHTSIEGNPFGGPIAHGLLLVSLALTLARDSGALPDATWVIYAFDKLRFRSPVRCGARRHTVVRLIEPSAMSPRIIGKRRAARAAAIRPYAACSDRRSTCVQ